MKTSFKRVLSVIVAFCILITSALCLAGINSAADTPDTTTVYKWEFGAVETTNYLKNSGGNIASNAALLVPFRFIYEKAPRVLMTLGAFSIFYLVFNNKFIATGYKLKNCFTLFYIFIFYTVLLRQLH